MGRSPHSFIALCLALSSPCLGEKSEYAVTLNRDSFDGFISERRSQQRAALVMFHVSWCKACQRTFPFFDAAAGAVQDYGVSVDFAHVECTDDKTLCQKYEVQGYPTIKLFFPEEDRPPQNFRGQRTQDGFLRYAKRMTSAPLRRMGSRTELVQAMAFEPYAAMVVAERYAEAFTPLAQKYMDRHVIAMAPTVSELIPQGLEVEGGEVSLAVLANPPQQWPGQGQANFAAAFYDGPMDNVTAVGSWLQRNRFPGVWALGQENFYEFTHADQSAVLVALGKEAVDEALEMEIRGAQKDQAGQFFLGVLNGSHWSEELKMFNIYPQELPRVLVSEKNFEIWVEDIAQLRVAHLRKDLAALAAGAPLLQQGRTILSKILFWKREAWRLGIRMKEHAGKGWMEGLTVAGAAFSLLVLVGLLGMCLNACCSALLTDEEPTFTQTKKRQ